MNGILIINKEKTFTSRDIVNILNKKLNTKKIGHTGTLDPIATGVLVICIGKYTKLVDKITSYDKEYIATIKLGIKTDTLDITGNILAENSPKTLTKNEIINTLNSFLGKSMQEVPKYSAIKIDGKKLYDYARNQEEITLPKREINITEIELLAFTKEEITFRVVVSKGTYIRSLIRDICTKLSVYGTMCQLTRTRQGNFTIDNALNLQDINNNSKLLTIKDIFNYPIYQLNNEEYLKVYNGNHLTINQNEPYLFLAYQNNIIAIYKQKDNYYQSYFRLI